MGKPPASRLTPSPTSTAMGHHRQLGYGRNTFGEGQRPSRHWPCSPPAELLSATAENAPGESSRTWRTPAYDVADRIPARSDPARPCRPARCTDRNAHPDEVPLRRADDSRYPEYALPKRQHMRGLRRARKGLLSCLGLETTEVRPGAVAVSSCGREGRPRRR
jgi:hypothetical protein